VGKPSGGFYILIKGQVRVILLERLEAGRGRRVSEIILNVLKEGDCFGEYSLIENKPGSASVIGSLPGEVLKIDRDSFLDLMSDDRLGKIIYKNLLRTLIKRLRKKEEELDLVLIAG